MDYRSAPRASHAGRTPAARKTHQRAPSNDTENAPGFLNFDSDRSTTLDSLKDLMAFSQRPKNARHDDILFAAKNARAQMPPQFREPPSSTGSHGTITTDSIHLGRGNDLTGDSAATSTFSPDAESTRASMHYQRGSHRVQRTTGRFGKSAREDKKATTEMLSGIVNTSALFRTFKEWQPQDNTDPSIFEDDAPSTTNFGVVNKLSRHDQDQENCGPIPSSPVPARRNRNILQPTVQNESDLSVVMTAAAQKQKPTKPATQPSPLRKASTTIPAPILKKSATVGTVGSMRGTQHTKKQQRVSVVEDLPLMDELTSPETSAGSREDIDLGVRTVAAPAPRSVTPPTPKAATVARSDYVDGATNQSFIVPSKSFPLLHNLVTGTLKFTPGTYFYGKTADAQRKYQLPAGNIPDDEKEIFVDIDNIREEVIRLQEHDEMLQNEIVQGELKYKSLLDRFYGLAHKSDSGIASGFDEPLRESLKESQEENDMLHNKIQELELDLDVIHTQYEEQVQASEDLVAERDAALARASSATEKANKLSADLEATRERLAASAQRPSQEAQRRIQQLEQMVTERERVIKALKDEREAATSSHREECRLYRERIARLEAEKMMLASDHAKCGDERYALNTAKEALALKNTALKQKVQAVREQGKVREASTHTVVERQRTQITKLQTLLREKEKSVHQLDENFRKLRESWSSKDETLMRMNEVLGQWPGGLPQEHRGALETEAEPTGEFDVDTRDFTFDDNEENQDEDKENQPVESDAGSDAGSAIDHSVDENMTSAFIIPDIDIHADEEAEEEHDLENDVENDADAEEAAAAENEREFAQELAQAHRIAARNSAAVNKSKTAQHKTVSFQTSHKTKTSTTTTATSVCKHNRVNCVICFQKVGHVGENEKVTVAVPRPISSEEGADYTKDVQKAQSEARDMDPGSALAYVMKLLDDERRHLWMQIQAMRKTGMTEEALNEKRRPRRALREGEELWNSYVLKVEQLNRLDDVLEGQRAAGQDMTREEIDVTITRILEA